jgi:hypothetical protein
MALNATVNMQCQNDDSSAIEGRAGRTFQHYLAQTAVPERVFQRASLPPFSDGGKIALAYFHQRLSSGNAVRPVIAK